MKKQIINKDTQEVLIELDLPYTDPKKWERALKAYEFDCEIEVVEVEDDGN